MKKKVLIIIIILIVLLTSFYFKFYVRKSHLSDEWLYNPAKDSGHSSFSTATSKGSLMSMATDSVKSFSATESASDYLGFSTGGAKTIENFRENIKNGYFPISTDITYNGLFYDYSFDTGASKAQSNELFYPSYTTAISNDIISGKTEYYMSVGLNSNIKESDFKRPKLNLVVVLDNSGSMGSSFDSYYYDGNYSGSREYKSKMTIANQCVNTLIDQLNKDDRFGMVIFNSNAQIAKYLSKIEDTDVETLKQNILDIGDRGGTNFEDGYKKALEIFKDLGESNKEYQNRIIVITDAMPNAGNTSSNSLMGMIEDNAKKNIYTSFVGVGVDFNTELIEKLGTVEGANYFSVHNEEEFKSQMGEDFDYMVTPLVFDLNLNFDSKDYTLEAVYGTDIENNKKGNIMHVNTLFPSKRNDSGEVKGGIILLKLEKKNTFANGKVTLEVTYKDTNSKEHKNTQEVVFDGNLSEHYDNTGIRKAIVLTRYANLLKDWILYERSNGRREFLVTEDTGIFDITYSEDKIIRILGEHERTSVPLTVSENYKELFKVMAEYIASEERVLNDFTLDQEIQILDRLVSKYSLSTYREDNSFFDFGF